MDNSKRPWASKSIWVAWIVASLHFIPGYATWQVNNPEFVGISLGVLFTLLRLVTKDKVSIGHGNE